MPPPSDDRADIPPSRVGEAMSDLFTPPPATPRPASPAPPLGLADAGNDPSGHRARLRTRLIDSAGAALADHEIIEYLLTTAIPRRDTKPIARTLLKRFGSLAGVFNADADALARHPGMGPASAAALLIVAEAARRFARAEATAGSVLDSWHKLIDYLTVDMAHITKERVRVLFLDTRNQLLRDETLAEGSIDEAAIYPREVIKRALDLGAAAMILVHNHPSGNPEPSRADIQITGKILEAGRHLGVAVHDHVVIGKTGHVSLRARGLL